jgi:hypothetical protein
MKVALVIATVLLLSIAAPVTSAVCTTDSATTATYNAFLEWFKSKNAAAVLATSAAVGTDLTCKDEWTAAGTCCTVEAIKAEFEKVAKGDGDQWNKFMESTKKFVDGLPKAIEISAKTTEITAIFTQSKTMATVEKPDRIAEMGFDAAGAATFLATIKDFKAEIDAFKTASKDCFETMKAYKAKLFCLGCAADGYTYFEKPNSAQGLGFKYKTGTCSGLTEKCIGSWKVMMKIQTYTGLLGVIREVKSKGAERPAKDPKKMFFKGKSPKDVKEAMDKCSTGKVEGTCLATDLDTICEAHLSISKPPRPAAVESGDVTMAAAGAGSPVRLLVDSADDEGSGSVSATGATLAATTSLSSSSSIDTTTLTGSSSNSSLRAFSIIFVALLAVLLN